MKGERRDAKGEYVSLRLSPIAFHLSPFDKGDIMFKNYLKIASRNLIKQKVYAFINVVGLAVGIFCALLAFLFVRMNLLLTASMKKRSGWSESIFK
jgi:hypothetical protein